MTKTTDEDGCHGSNRRLDVGNEVDIHSSRFYRSY